MNIVNNDPDDQLPERELERDHDELLQRRHVRRRRRARVGPRLHASTRHGLIYQWQPGALNESYSDILGETVDLINGVGSDTADRPRGVTPARRIRRRSRSCLINTPASIAGTVRRGLRGVRSAADSAPARRGTSSSPTTASADPSTSNACTALPAGSMTGKIGLVDRGICAFTVKVKNAQDAGAIGVVVANNDGRARRSGSAAATRRSRSRRSGSRTRTVT